MTRRRRRSANHCSAQAPSLCPGRRDGAYAVALVVVGRNGLQAFDEMPVPYASAVNGPGQPCCLATSAAPIYSLVANDSITSCLQHLSSNHLPSLAIGEARGKVGRGLSFESKNDDEMRVEEDPGIGCQR
jgi:hypothetical protein